MNNRILHGWIGSSCIILFAMSGYGIGEFIQTNFGCYIRNENCFDGWEEPYYNHLFVYCVIAFTSIKVFMITLGFLMEEKLKRTE